MPEHRVADGMLQGLVAEFFRCTIMAVPVPRWPVAGKPNEREEAEERCWGQVSDSFGIFARG